MEGEEPRYGDEEIFNTQQQDDGLDLSLSLRMPTSRLPEQPPIPNISPPSSLAQFFQLSPNHSAIVPFQIMLPQQPLPLAVHAPIAMHEPIVGAPTRKPSQDPLAGKSAHIEPPFPWATDRRAAVHSISLLQSLGITDVTGEMKCRKCNAREVVAYDIRAKFGEVVEFMKRSHPMNERAPLEWMKPTLASCRACKSAGRMEPALPEKRRNINWLFMFLGQTLGCCSIKDLKYFCKHNGHHRTGAKDRVLFSTYASICRQLKPTDTFLVQS